MTRIFILWDNSYSVGNNVIDTQHQKFISIINELYESFVDQTANQKLDKIFKELVDYSSYHFKTEEELFEKYKYPDKELHNAHHIEFTLKINEFVNEFLNGKVNLTFQLMNYLRNWLLNHIKSEDQEYAAYIKAKESIIKKD
jgi:hemerythrin-like metal-binding protein